MNPRVVSRTLLVVALVCFVIAFVITTGMVHSGNFDAWLAAGLAAFVAAHLAAP